MKTTWSTRIATTASSTAAPSSAAPKRTSLAAIRSTRGVNRPAERRWTQGSAFIRLDGVPGEQVVAAVAASLGAGEGPGRSAQDAPLVEHLVVAAPRATFLATSREPLNVGREITFRVPRLAESDAVSLLRLRSRSHWDDADAMRFCAAHDFVPLAIEIAAANEGSRVVADERDDPIVAAVASSLSRIGPDGRALLAFIAACPAGVPPQALDVTRLQAGELEALVAKSLVTAEQAASTTRYRVIEPLRDALSSILDGGELDTAADQRLSWCRHVAASLDLAQGTHAEPAAIAAADAEERNMRATLGAITHSGSGADLAEMVTGLSR